MASQLVLLEHGVNATKMAVLIPTCSVGSTLRKAVPQLPSIQTEVSKEYSVGKEGAMASSPNTVHPGAGCSNS